MVILIPYFLALLCVPNPVYSNATYAQPLVSNASEPLIETGHLAAARIFLHWGGG